MSVVLDSSITLSWYFEDEQTPAGQAVLDQVIQGGAYVPSLWRLEVGNTLLIAVRRKRIDRFFRDDALQRLGSLGITIDHDTDAVAWTASLRLADQFSLTLYDAAYLELAQRLKLPLATLDKAMRAAAGAHGIPLLGIAP